jgi:MINDY deubiquitinase
VQDREKSKFLRFKGNLIYSYLTLLDIYFIGLGLTCRCKKTVRLSVLLMQSCTGNLPFFVNLTISLYFILITPYFPLKGKDDAYVNNQQQNIADAIDLLPRLATGIDVNVLFRK